MANPAHKEQSTPVPRFISYDEWLQMYADDNAEIECYKCDGTGEAEDECPHCGQDMDGGECDICDGIGVLYAGDLDVFSLRKSLPETIYKRSVTMDAVRYSLWTGNRIDSVLDETGLAPYTEFNPDRNMMSGRIGQLLLRPV